MILNAFHLPKCREIGTFNTVENIYNTMPTARFFNELDIQEDIVIKRPRTDEHRHLIEKEAHWYQAVSEKGFTGIPKLLQASPLTIERIKGNHPYALEIDLKEREQILIQIIQRLQQLHQLSTRPPNTNDLRLEYIDKTKRRFEQVRGMFADCFYPEYQINQKTVPNIFHDKYKDRLASIADSLPCKEFTIIHGDPTFSNMMIDEQKNCWLIDPRGYFGSQLLYGDPHYDFYKLFYSLVGNYDAFNRKQFTLIKNNNKVTLSLPKNPWADLEPIFFAETGLARRDVYIAHGLIWLSLAGYALDDVDSIYGAFFRGLEWLSYADELSST